MNAPPRRIGPLQSVSSASFVTIAAFVPIAVWVSLLAVFVPVLGAQSFRARVDSVQVTVTVTDANGRLVPGLTRDDFEIYEEGVLQPITQFTDRRVPVSLGVLLDASDSMRGRPIEDARTALDRFVGELLDAEDEAFVATFNHRPSIAATWTRPPSGLANALQALMPSGGTALYDALAASTGFFSGREHTRAALVVISDGADTASDLTLHQALDAVRRTDPFVYAIAIDPEEALASTRVNPYALREITTLSGGYTEVVRSAADLGPATERIAIELNSQYTLAYDPTRPMDGTWRAIRVRVGNPDYFARARRGYYAEGDN